MQMAFRNKKRAFKDTKESFEIAKDVHSLFLQAMEERYREILTFLGFVIPAFTGFVWLVYQYETASPPKSEMEPIFFIGGIAILGVLLWGGLYVLATSYRYRYLQTSVYRIEEALGAAKYIPRSFKPVPLRGVLKRLCLSMAPGILQIHIFFFLVAIIGVGISYFIIAKHDWHRIVILCGSVVCDLIIYLFGAFYYPMKLSTLIETLYHNGLLSTVVQKIIFITGPSGVGKSTLRNYYCLKRSHMSIPAVTTRKQRVGEHEIHRNISQEKFERLLSKGKLCLVSENHGFFYGYKTAEILSAIDSPVIIEVDSKTAIEERDIFSAYLVRVLPSSINSARRIISSQKRDGIDDRIKDLEDQMTQSFVEERTKAGDIIFINNYDRESLDRFVGVIDSIVV